jgi:WD40 repeat protein
MLRMPALRAITVDKLICALLFIPLLAACAPKPQSILIVPASPPATLTDDVEPAATPAPVEPTPTATVEQPPAPAGDGSRLLINTAQGLWAANPDGSGGTLLTGADIIIPGSFPGAVSPSGGYFAYLTTTDNTKPYGNYPNLKLNILDLTRRNPLVTLPLTSPQTEPGAEFPSDITRAMVERQSFAWSPDGTRLAYIGAADGPSADLYLYDLRSGATLRLTDGADQGYNPRWSPDGKWIVHASAAGFGTGAGIAVTGFFAARADGSGVISLYAPDQHSGGEAGTGWLNSHTLVAHSWFITCGPSDLRVADLDAKKTDLVFEGCLSAVAVGGGSALFAQSPGTAMFDDAPRPGLFLVTESNRTPQKISDANIRDIVWSEGAGSFLAIGEETSLYEIWPTGAIRLLPENQSHIPAVSPDGRYWFLADSFWNNSLSGIWIGEFGQPLRQVFTQSISPNQILFAPDGSTLYFLDSAGGLYRADAPDWAPVLLASDLQPVNAELAMAWG